MNGLPDWNVHLACTPSFRSFELWIGAQRADVSSH